MLEYSPPARGTWTIAHVPLLIPEAYIIFVGASCCMRGVILSAAECGALDRFSTIIVKEDDLFNGNMENMFVDGTVEILDALAKLPPCVVLFSGCIHEAAGNDMDYVRRRLEEKYPTVDFIFSKMNPTMRKSGITPEELMRQEMYAPLRYDPTGCNEGRMMAHDERSVNIIGNIAQRSAESEPLCLLKNAGYTVRDICYCKTYSQYLDMAKSAANIYMTPVASKGAVALSNRLGQKLFYFPVSFDMEELGGILRDFCRMFDLELPDIASLVAEAKSELHKASDAVRGMHIVIDFSAVSRPFSLAKLLIESGMDVRVVYTDTVAEGDETYYQWLVQNVPDMKVTSVTNSSSRWLHSKAIESEKYMAIGQKAAYFCNTKHFVNIVENGALWGFNGIKELARAIVAAAVEGSDMRSIIQVKAWGCCG